jgi:hypothetical protein
LEIGMVDSEGSTALHTAAAAAHVEFCRYVCFSVSSTVLLAVSICIEAVLALSRSALSCALAIISPHAHWVFTVDDSTNALF